MVRPTSAVGVGFFFQWSAQRVCSGFFQWSAQRAQEGLFFNGLPNAPDGVSFSMVWGPIVFQWFAQRARGDSFLSTGLPNPVLILVRPTRLGLILVCPTCAWYWLAQPCVNTGLPNWARFCVFLHAFGIAPFCTLIAP